MIILTAYNQDTESYRLKRLDRLRKILKWMDIAKGIKALHDHKGRLHVCWKELPATAITGRIGEIWYTVFHQPPSGVSHVKFCSKYEFAKNVRSES